MIQWTPIFHIYQPPQWDRTIIDRVVREGYRKFCAIIRRNPEFKCTVNVTGSLTEQLVQYGYQDVIDELRAAVRRGQVELIGSAKYHPVLALLPDDEIVRQIELNDNINRSVFGEEYHPNGFWIPELCYSRRVIHVLEQREYKWIIVDPISVDHELPSIRERLQLHNSSLSVLVRNRAASDAFFIPTIKTAQDFFAYLHTHMHHESKVPLITAMDGENIGHHRPESVQLFTDLIHSKKCQFMTGSELLRSYRKTAVIRLRESSWASQMSEIHNHIPYVLWNDSTNSIHHHLWKLLHDVRAIILRHKHDAKFTTARTVLDERLMSDQFWWASAKPWWDAHIVCSMIRKTAEVPRILQTVSAEELMRIQQQEDFLIRHVLEWESSGRANRIR
ncbi:MAG TPA: hypothetical protein VJB65_05095, partial [Patescibacteria group bacterium]|nr:hypothetical protein [Patescibacteria group bacterium]